jgi:hypothetical protein
MFPFLFFLFQSSLYFIASYLWVLTSCFQGKN